MDRTRQFASITRRTAFAARAAAAGRAAALAALASGAMLVAPAAHAQADAWTGPDKVKHFGMSAPLGMVGSAMVPREAPFAQRVLYGTLLGSLPGLAKELSDMGRPGATASMKDMTFNVLGAALGASLAECCLIRPLGRGERIDGIGVEYRIEF
jgi:uncharacterized protein YfiM (DUF2279 family)